MLSFCSSSIIQFQEPFRVTLRFILVNIFIVAIDSLKLVSLINGDPFDMCYNWSLILMSNAVFPNLFSVIFDQFRSKLHFLRLLELYQKSKHTVSLKNTKKVYDFSPKTLKPYSFCSAKAGQG
jgi:hypothetical protein